MKKKRRAKKKKKRAKPKPRRRPPRVKPIIGPFQLPLALQMGLPFSMEGPPVVDEEPKTPA